MRKLFSIALTLAMLLVPMGAMAQTTYLDEDFSGFTSAGVGTGWDRSDNDPTTLGTSYQWKGSTTGYSGNCAYCYMSGASALKARLKSPDMNLPQMKSVLLSFMMKGNQDATKCGVVNIYVSTDGGANYVQNAIATNVAATSQWTEHSYTITGYSGQVKLVIEAVGSGSTIRYLYIDNLVVKDIPTCQAPKDLYVSGLTGTSANINWDLDTRYGVTPDQYSVTLRDANNSVVFYDSAVTSSPVAFTGLQNNSQYIAYVRSNCEVRSFQGKSDSLALGFTTLPTAINPPFSESFDTMTATGFPPSGYYCKNATLNTSSYYSLGSTGKSVKLTTTATDEAYIVFPLMNIAANDMEMDFNIRRQGNATANVGTIGFKAGYLTDPSDVTGTFTPGLIDSLVTGTDYVNYRFNTGSLQDATTPVMGCIMIDAAFATSVYVDQVSIHTIPTCSRPEHLSCTNITDQTATLTWDMSNASSFNVTAMDLADSTRVTQTATSSPYTVTGLTQNTSYAFTVQGVCSPTDLSEASTAITAKTTCSVADTAIFSEGAEATTGSALPDCWSTGYLANTGTATTAPFTTSTAQKAPGGSRSFRMAKLPSGSKTYLSSQAINFDQSGRYSFRYKVYRPAGTTAPGEGFKVVVAPNAGDTTNGVEVIGFVNSSAGNTPTATTVGWNEYEGIINYQGTGYVTIVGYCEYGDARYIDDLEVVLTPTCAKASNVRTSNLTSSSTTVLWTPGGSESQWQVRYTVTNGSTTVCDTSFAATTASFDIEGLAAATSYNINGSVRAYCGVGDTAEAAAFGFDVTTRCLALATLPYTNDFENEVTGGATSQSTPDCWSRFNDAANTSTGYPYVASNASYANSGTKYLYFFASIGATYAEHQVAILPEIDATANPINTLRMKFWAKRHSTTSYADAPLVIGFMSDPTDLATFVAVDTVVVTSTGYQEYTSEFTSYGGTGTFPAIRLDRQSANCYCYLDDITVDAIPDCQDLSGSVTISDVTDTSVKVTLSDLTAASGWSFAYGTAGTSVNDMVAIDTTIAVVTLTGLSATTSYDIYARRDCGNGSYSPWSPKVTFSTTAVPATTPYSCGFENLSENANWQIVAGANATNKFAIGLATGAVHNGAQAIYVSADNGANNSYNNSYATRTYAYRTIHFDAKGYQISFDWRCNGGEGTSTIYDYGRVMLIPASVQLTAGATNTSITSSNTQAGFPESAIFLDPDSALAMYLADTAWHRVSKYVNLSAAPGNYNLVLAWNNDGSGGTTDGPLSIDDISVAELTCIPPTTVTTAMTSSSATLSVTQAGCSEWQFVADTLPFTKDAVPANPMFRTNSTSGTATLTGLNPNTVYYYTVRSICGAGDTSSWLQTASLRTRCTAYQVPYTEGFENATDAYCWTMMASDTEGASVERYTARHHGNTGTACLKSTKASVVTPELGVDSLTRYMLSGYAYSIADSITFAIGVIVDPNDADTYDEVSYVTIPAKNTWTEFTAYFSQLSDPAHSTFRYAKHIVLAVSGENTLYFDDIDIDLRPVCSKPTEVSITNVDAHSFDISFTDNASASSWIVYTNGTPHVITTNPATVTGLAATTSYTVTIAALCGDTSDLTACGTIRTTCDQMQTPWTCGFETSEGYIGATSFNIATSANFDVGCWTILNQSQSASSYPYVFVSTSNSYVHTGSQAAFTYTSSRSTRDLYMILPEFAQPSDMLKINLWYKNMGATANAAQLKVGYFTDPTDETSFVSLVSLDKSSTWTEGEVLTNTAGYNVPTTARIGFMIDRGSYGYPICIDDITVNLIRNCSDPSTPVVTDLSATAARISFTDTCTTHANWEYVYGEKGFDANSATPVAIDTTTFDLVGLTGDTEYDVYVRAICGVGDTSNFIKGSFKTLCSPFHVTATAPFTEDFNGYNYGSYFNTGTCYDILNEPDNNSYKAKAYPASMPSATASTYYFYGHTADRYDRCLYWCLSRTYATEGAVTRQFHLDGGTTYEVSAWVRNSTATSCSSKLSALYGASNTTLDTISSIVVNGESTTREVIDGKNTYPYNTLYQQFKVLVTPDSTGDYYIGYHFGFNNTNTTTYLYLDDWSIRAYTGCAPKMPSIDSIATTSVRVSVNDTAAYQFEYVLNDTNATATVATTNTFTVTNLTPSTQYTLYLRRYCNATSYSEWAAVQFTTACAAVSTYPYTEGFEGSFPPVCWSQFYYGTSTAYGWVAGTSSSYIHTGSKSAYISYSSTNGKAVLVSGEFNLTSPYGYYVRLWSYRSSATSYADKTDEALHIGYLNAPIDASNIDQVNEIGVINRNPTKEPVESGTSEGYYLYEFQVPAGVTGPVWFSFDFHSQNGLGYAFDDLTIEPMPSCVAPKTAPTVSATTMSTATVNVDMGSKPAATVSWTMTSKPDSVAGSALTTNGTVVATGLARGTSYYFTYAYVCSAGDTSASSPAVIASTTTSDCFAPQNLHTVGIVNAHHAGISWGKAPDAQYYQYLLKRGSNVIDSVVAPAQTLGDTITYDSLSASTPYTFLVRTLCSYDTSAWVTLNFSTTPECLSLPFVCGFEDGDQNNQWQINMLSATGNNALVIGNGVSKTGSNSLYVSDDNSTYQYTTASSASVYDAEILIEVPAGNCFVSYDWKCKGEGSYDFGRIFLIPSSTTVTGSASSDFNATLPSGAISLDRNNRLNQVDGWTSYSDIVSIAQGNVYKLVVVWANDASAGSQPPLAIDNIRIEEVNCMPVNAVTMVTINPTSATAVVTPYDPTAAVEYALSVLSSEDSVSTWTAATSDTLSFSGLATGTAYYLYVRHACSATDKSPARVSQFTTPKDAVNLPFVATFEVGDTTLNNWTMTSGTALNRFVVGSAASHTGSQSLYVTDDGTARHYSSLTSNTVNSYAYIPIQLSAGSYEASYSWACHGESSSDYGHLFLIPASSTPEDNVQMNGMTATSVPTGAISLNGSYTRLNSVDSLNDVWYDVATEFALSNAGTYNLVAAWHNDGTINHQPPLAIDDIHIRQLTCPRLDAGKVSLDSVSTSLMRIKVRGNNAGAGIIYHVASDASFSDTVAYGTTADSLFTVTGLSASSWYNVRLWSYCGVGDTSMALSVRYRTDCGTVTTFPYDEGFESYSAGTSHKTELTDNCWIANASSSSVYHCIMTSSAYVHGGSKALYLYNTTTSGANQVLALPLVDTLAGKQLSLWYQNYSSTATGTAILEVGYLSNPDNLSSFTAIATAPYSTTYAEFVIDYPATTPAGARPAFKANGTQYLCVDDIHLNRMVQGNVYYDTICYGGSYQKHGFVCPASSLAAGDTTLSATMRSSTPGVADSAMTVHLYVRPEIVNNYFDTICYGEPYTRGLFNIPNPQTRIYFRTFTSSTGCDSTVNLSLYVYPDSQTLNDTICQGDSYQFGSQSLTQTGTYSDSLVNPRGCTVFTTLNLFVMDSVVVTNASICQGESYLFEGQTYTQSGTYRVATVGARGCGVAKVLNLTVYQTDSVCNVSFCHGGSVQVADTTITTAGTYTMVRINLHGCNVTYHITATEDALVPDEIYDFACEGKPYSGYGISNLTVTGDTIVTIAGKTIDARCDSVANIHLTYIATAYSDTTAWIRQGESIIWNDNSYSVAGSYSVTLQSVVTGCDSVATLHLNVQGVGVDNVTDIGISVVPNPVNAGETSFVYGDFTDVESVDILNSFGQVIDTFVPETYPIEVKGISTSGIYYVRLTTKSGSVHLTKLIVR